MMKKIIITTMVLFALSFSASALAIDTSARRFISYEEAERLSLANSHQIESQSHVVAAASDTAFAQEVKRMPQLSFGAGASLTSKIGQITIPALGVNQQVGERLNWMVGPAIDFVIWDAGQIINRAKSLWKKASSESNVLDYDKRQALLNGRAAYIRVQIAKEQARLVTDAISLARAQYAYVLDRKNAGTADLFDLTVAHQEMSDREKDLDQARGELAVSKRNLMGALSLDDEMANADNVDVEPILSVLDVMLPRSDTEVDIESHPQVKEYADMQKASELGAKSTIAKYFPEIKFRGQSTFEYPNLGQSDTIQQNRAMFNLSVPILDWGVIAKEAASQKYQAKAANETMKQMIVELTQNVSDTRSNIGTYKKLKVSTTRAAEDAVEVARLSFDSYKTGRIIFLDVQRANVKALSALVEQARTEAMLGLEIAKLLALAETEGEFK